MLTKNFVSLPYVFIENQRKFLFEIFNLPYESKKERKSLLSDKTVKISKEDSLLSLKNYPLQTFKYEHLVVNYDSMFSSIVFLFLIMQNYFTGMPTNMSSSEQKNFKKNVLEEKKMSNLCLLKKWIKNRSDDFYGEMILYNIAMVFLKYLKKNEIDERILKLIVRVIKLLDEQKNKGLSNSFLHIKYQIKKDLDQESLRNYSRVQFNKLSYKEVARILTFIDIKMFLKLNFYQLDQNEKAQLCNERILSLSKFLEMNFSSQRKTELKIGVLKNYFELARFLYQEKNYFSLYILIITMVSKTIQSFLIDNIKSIEKYYINAAKDLNFYQKLYSDSFRSLKDKLNHHQNEKCPCIPLFKVYQKELFIIEKKFSMFEKKSFLIIEKIFKMEKTYGQISCFKNLLIRQATICYQGFTKNEDYYFLKSYYNRILSQGMD